MMDHKNVKQMVFLAVMTSSAIIIHFIESLFPLPFALPGVKLGLSNTVSLIVLNIYGPVPAFSILNNLIVVSCRLSGVIFSLAEDVSFSAAVLIWKLGIKGSV